MAKFFVSYSRVDKTFTQAFVTGLEHKFPKHSFWYDLKLTGGDAWWKVILSKIEEADIFIYLLSNESITSSYCQAEFQESRRLRKRVIPVQVRDRTKITGDLGAIQYVDMKSGFNNAVAQNELTRAINLQLDATPLRRLRPLSKIPTPKPDIKPEAQRPAGAPDIDTPGIQITALIFEERTRTIPARVLVKPLPKSHPPDSKVRRVRLLVLVLLLAIVVALVVFRADVTSYLLTGG